MISVYLDTNCINARQNDSYINGLEELYDKEEIIIEKTDTLDKELQEKKGYPKGLKKSMKYIESYGPVVFNHSRLGHSVPGDKSDEVRLSTILEIIWGKKVRSSYKEKDMLDAIHISTAIRYGGTYFVTDDKKLLDKANQIEKGFGIKIRTPKVCLTEIRKRLREIKELEK